MSKKSEEGKEKTAKDEEKPEETEEKTAKTEAEPEEKPPEAEAEPEETPVKAEAEPEEAEEKTAKDEEKPAETKDKTEPPDAGEKPLEKMTVKELREMAKEMPGITGVHGMKKDELIVVIKKVKGIADEPVKKADANIAELKQKIKALKVQRQEALAAKDKKKATIFKRRISRLKKKTRRAAA